MEYMQASAQTSTLQNILCCQCGTPTPPNASSLCIACIRTHVDITEGIQKQAYLQFCKSCERYLQPPSLWIHCQLESRELLALCLKRLKNLKAVHMVDAGFVWTEPHSKRLKVKLVIQKEVLNSTILEQSFVVEFIVQGQMCEDCHRREAQDFWKAVVQIRQKVPHKKTFYYLEQLILKQSVHQKCLNIKQVHDGLDFYFANRQEGKHLVDFLQNVVCCRYKTAERLISHDIQNSSYNYKHTFSVELVPVCKGDIVCLPKKMAHSMGNMSQIAICHKVSNTLHFIDPITGIIGEMSNTNYWRQPFQALGYKKSMTEFTILEMEKDYQQAQDKRFCQADVYLMRNTDTSGSDTQFHCRTHLGHVFKDGDTVQGLDLTTANLNDENLDKMNKDKVADVVLVKKVYADKKRRTQARKWKLKTLPKELELQKDKDKDEQDFDDFLEDLEEDKDYRQNVKIFKDNQKMASQLASGETDPDMLPMIGLEEMLDDLVLEDQPMESEDDSDSD